MGISIIEKRQDICYYTENKFPGRVVGLNTGLKLPTSDLRPPDPSLESTTHPWFLFPWVVPEQTFVNVDRTQDAWTSEVLYMPRDHRWTNERRRSCWTRAKNECVDDPPMNSWLNCASGSGSDDRSQNRRSDFHNDSLAAAVRDEWT